MVGSTTVNLMPKMTLKSGEMVSVSLCSSSVVPSSIAVGKDLSVIGKLYAKNTLLVETISHKFDRVNTITAENLFVEGTSSPDSVFKMRSFVVKDGTTAEHSSESGFTKNRLKFTMTMETPIFDDQHLLVILSDALYSQHLGYSHKMAVYL